MRSVVIHSYVKGAKAKSRLIAHIKYIANRPGSDREEGHSRLFFNNKRDDIGGKELRDLVSDMKQERHVLAHKFILSPGIQGVDMQKYTRELVEGIGRHKGLDLDWRAVTHKNTDHDHAHVIVFATDKSGYRKVTFNRSDYTKLRELGDRYLERDHYYERFMTRDADRALKSPEYNRASEFQLLVGGILSGPGITEKEKKHWTKDAAVSRLPDSEKIVIGPEVHSKYSTQKELMDIAQDVQSGALTLPLHEYQQVKSWIEVKEKLGDDYYERIDKGDKEIMLVREFHKFDRDLKRTLASESEFKEKKGHDARIRETAGRFSDYHEFYTSAMAKERLLELKAQRPDMASDVDKELAFLKEIERESRFGGQDSWRRLDEILGENFQRHKSSRGTQQKNAEERSFVDQHISVEEKNKDQHERNERDDDDKRSDIRGDL